MKTALCIGGSAGSFNPVISLLKEIKITNELVIFLCIHRGKNRTENFASLLSELTGVKIMEPDDKDSIDFGKCYMAPANYHLTLDKAGYISLQYSEEVNYSRPSIDVMFESVASYFKENTIGVILSGANADGAKGLMSVYNEHGICIVQNPNSASVPTMPLACSQIPNLLTYETEQIADYLNLVPKIFR